MTASLGVRPAQDSETPATPVFAAPIRHPSAWTVADFRSPSDYSVDLDAAQLRDIAYAMRRIKAAGIGLDGLQREHFEVLSLRPVVEEILRQIKDGRGFVLLRGLPVEDYSKDELGLIFWGIGTHLGSGHAGREAQLRFAVRRTVKKGRLLRDVFDCFDTSWHLKKT